MSKAPYTIFSSLPPLKCSYQPVQKNEQDYVALENIVADSPNNKHTNRCSLFCCWGFRN